MKFRYKVLIINIILLSIGIGTVGFLMIRKNFNLVLNSQIKNAIEENNLFQSSIEYELLDLINSGDTELTSNLSTAASRVTSAYGISANRSELFIIYDSEQVYPTTEQAAPYPDSLFQSANIGEKNYIITSEGNAFFIYVTSANVVLEKNMYIINRRDISEVYNLIDEQEKYFSILLLLVLFLLSFFMIIVSYLLTKPLEKLSKVAKLFGEGRYETRTDIKTSDEVGALAVAYNTMADAVETHVKELNGMIERQDQFVADFTHEMKTPMTSIIGYADTIRSKEISRENQIMAASYIFNESKRLEAMSRKLFEFIYTKQHDIVAKPFSTARLMHEVSDSVMPSLEKKHITLSLEESENCRINGDIELLKSAFINLIDNARKASDEYGKIIFSGKMTDGGYQIAVCDFGMGISEEHLHRICDEFYMVDKSRSRQEGGAGLGLSLAALIFKCHNADFHIESTPGEGTTMQITFPNSQQRSQL